MAPAYVFRFDPADGSVVFSGDTGICDNLITLADGADVLVHEVIDEHWVQARYADEPVRSLARSSRTTPTRTRPSPTSVALPQSQRRHARAQPLRPGEIDRPRSHEAADKFDGTLIVGADLDRIPVSR